MLEDWNVLLAYLAEAEVLSADESYDLLILAGNSLPYVTEAAGELYQAGVVPKILTSGGIGHATKYLRENFAKLGFEFSESQSEAEMNQLYLYQKFDIPLEDILAERTSTNSGENALFSLRECQKKVMPQRVILMQDPILQRRIKAAFQKVWAGTGVRFTNYVPAIPRLLDFSDAPVFDDARLNGAWQVDYFVDLVLGELPRLRNDADGYGPKGKDFIVAVAVPEAVELAFERLCERYHGRR